MKKKKEGYVLFYDRVVMPDGMTLKEIIKTAKDTRIVNWDSTKPHEGKPIQLCNLGGETKGDILYWKTRCVKTGKEEFVIDL